MLNFLLPYSQIDTSNPIFQRDLRRLRWLRNPQSLRRYCLIVILGIPLLTLSWWILERAAYGFDNVRPFISSRLISLCVYSMAALMLASSFYTAVSTIGYMHRYFESDEWSLLRITPQDEQAILRIKDAIVQIFVWRLAVFEVGVRLALILLLNIDDWYGFWQISDDKSSFLRTTILNPLLWLPYALHIGIGLLISIEPLLRMRAVVALCSAVSAGIRTPTLALLAGFLAVSLLIAPQIIAIDAIWQMMYEEVQIEPWATALVIFIPFNATIAAFFCMAYFQIRRKALSLTRRAACER